MRCRESVGKATRDSQADGNQLRDQVGENRLGKAEERERKTKIEGWLQGDGGRELGGLEDLHLSFWSISGACDRELIQVAGVPIHLVNDEHLQGRRACTQISSCLHAYRGIEGGWSSIPPASHLCRLTRFPTIPHLPFSSLHHPLPSPSHSFSRFCVSVQKVL